MELKLKKKYLDMIYNIYLELQKTDLLERLDEIDTVMTFEYYEISDEFEGETPLENTIPLGYIYRKKYMSSPREVFDTHIAKRDLVSREDYVKYLKSISLSLYEQCMTGIFDNIQILMSDNFTDIPIPGAPKDISYFFQNYLRIYLGKIEVLSVAGSCAPRDLLVDDIQFDQNEVFNNIENLLVKKISSLAKNIESQVWFEYLCKESQELVLAGENLMAHFNVELNKGNEDHFDLSCFLLPFVKAIENEVPNLVERYFPKIFDISINVQNRINELEKAGNKRLAKKYDPLNNLVKKVIQNQNTIGYINSISDLYYIIYYFGFVENLDLVENAKCIFEDSIMENLKKERRIIDELQLLGKDRNNFIHVRLITQLNEFSLHLDKIYLVLGFLATFKQLSKQTN